MNSDWRHAEEGPAGSSSLDRSPAVGIAIALLLVAGAVAAFILAARAGNREPAPAVLEGGTLRVGVVGLSSLDPLDARDPTAMMVVDQLFDTLVGYAEDTLAIEPSLAASWEVNSDQTVFTFRLVEGATFHDGSPVTAADVKFTLERIARPGSESPLVAHLEVVSGFGPFHREGTASELGGVEVSDPVTVVVRLDEPFSTFPEVLGHPGFGIVPRAAVEELAEGFKERPVGSGPFAFAGKSPDGSRLELSRHPGRRPAATLEGIHLVEFDDAEAAYSAFGDGELDVAPVPPAQVGDAAGRFGTRGMTPFLGVVFYAMNVRHPDLADVRLRQAVSFAIDRERIVAEVYRGEVEVASGLVAKGVPGRAPDACGARCAHDPQRARVLLAEAFPLGPVPEVAIDHDDDPTQTAVAASIKADLDAVGIPAVVRARSLADYGRFLVSGDQELFRLGWIADYPSPDGFLTPLFLSTSPENVTGLAVPDIDDGLRAARAEPDAARRHELYRDVEQKILDRFVVVPVAQLELRLVVAERVLSFYLSPLGTFDGSAVALAAE